MRQDDDRVHAGDEKALTAEDVAAILHVSKSSVYNLVRQGELQSYNVGRKMRFTRKQVSDYISWSSSKQQVKQTSSVSPSYRKWLESQEHIKNTLTICGQDVILDVLANYLQQSGVYAKRAFVNSYDGLVMLYHDEADIASVHMWDSTSNTYNEPYIRQLLPGVPVVSVRLAIRQQGFCVAKGNPKSILTWKDLSRREVRMGNLPTGNGSRVLLDGHLSLLSLDAAEIKGYDTEYISAISLAEDIVSGAIDVGICDKNAIQCMEGVEFVPLQKEEFDLVMKQKVFASPEAQALLHIIRSLPFKKQFNGVAGYETGQMGRVILN